MAHEESDDLFVLDACIQTPIGTMEARVFGRCYLRNYENTRWSRFHFGDRNDEVALLLSIATGHFRSPELAEILRLRAKERETDRRLADLEAVASSALGLRGAPKPPEFTYLEHEMAPATAWVLANKHGNVLTRFCGLKKTASAVEEFEIAFFDSQAEAEGVHDAMGLRGTVRPQLVNRRTLEPVA